MISTRVRVLIATILTGLLGWVYLSWSLQLAADTVRASLGHYFAPCSGTWRDVGYTCRRGSFSAALGWFELILATLVVLGCYWLLARWALRPLRQLAGLVRSLGPQNLGERANVTGPNDEARRLADAIDAMLDRVAEGYEGQRRFAANASHELRTPLAVQRTLIEVSLADSPTDEQRALLTRQLLATNERNEELIESLLVLAETDRGLMSRTPQRLDAAAAEAAGLFADQAAAAGVSLRCRAEEPVQVDGEQTLLDRLIANLVQNAIKYNEPGGRVDIEVRRPAQLVVANTGPKVPAAMVPGLFEPFRRLAGQRIDHSGGAGLGLTIARSITQAHDATIQAEPNPDGGLTVVVDFLP